MNSLTKLISDALDIDDHDASIMIYMELYDVPHDQLNARIRDMLDGKIKFDAAHYNALKAREQEWLHNLETPLEVEEGVLQCRRCGSKRTISFQRQIRSADEGATTFAECVQCGAKWKNNN